MTIEEYQDKKEKLHKDYQKNLYDLAMEYAKANCIYVAGDIVEDHMGYFKIEKIAYCSTWRSKPSLVFKGVELTKKLVVKKRPTRDTIFSSNIERKVE